MVRSEDEDWKEGSWLCEEGTGIGGVWAGILLGIFMGLPTYGLVVLVVQIFWWFRTKKRLFTVLHRLDVRGERIKEDIEGVLAHVIDQLQSRDPSGVKIDEKDAIRRMGQFFGFHDPTDVLCSRNQPSHNSPTSRPKSPSYF